MKKNKMRVNLDLEIRKLSKELQKGQDTSMPRYCPQIVI
jgi:hypothetical protein